MRCGGSGGRPVAVRAVLDREAIAGAMESDPRQLYPREGRAIADVVRIIRRNPALRTFPRPKAAERFPWCGRGRGCISAPAARRGRGSPRPLTSMPRHARSIASVSPTGPAPTINSEDRSFRHGVAFCPDSGHRLPAPQRHAFSQGQVYFLSADALRTTLAAGAT